MELKDFIRETLLQIMAGVEEAKNGWKGGGVINPVLSLDVDFTKNQLQEVCFDVAVTAQDEKTGGAGGGIRVFSVDLAGKAERTTTNSTVSRISFKIPIMPPLPTG